MQAISQRKLITYFRFTEPWKSQHWLPQQRFSQQLSQPWLSRQLLSQSWPSQQWLSQQWWSTALTIAMMLTTRITVAAMKVKINSTDGHSNDVLAWKLCFHIFSFQFLREASHERFILTSATFSRFRKILHEIVFASQRLVDARNTVF